MTPGHTGIGPQDFVTPENACFIEVASNAVLAVGALIVAPIAIEFVAAAATDAAATIADEAVTFGGPRGRSRARVRACAFISSVWQARVWVSSRSSCAMPGMT